MLSSTMNPILRRLCGEYEEQLRGETAERMQLRPAGETARWNVQQTVEHMLMTYAATSGNFEKRLAKGTVTEAKATFGHRIGQFAVCTLGQFPKGRKAPEIVTPKADTVAASGDELLEKVKVELERFDGLALEAERVFGPQRAITHLVLGPMSVHNWRRFHLIHGEHHLRQIGKVLAPRPRA